MDKYFSFGFSFMDDNKYLLGVSMICLNIGSKYLVHDISKTQDALLKNNIMRKFVIFSLIYISTKDTFLSLLFTAVFTILTMGLFNEESKFCILPRKLKNIEITKEEYDSAITLTKKYEEQQKNLLLNDPVQHDKNNYYKLKQEVINL